MVSLFLQTLYLIVEFCRAGFAEPHYILCTFYGVLLLHYILSPLCLLLFDLYGHAKQLVTEPGLRLMEVLCKTIEDGEDQVGDEI